MQYRYPESLANLIKYLATLPGIGPKTAQRLAFHLLNENEENALGLARAIPDARAKVRRCVVCGNLTDSELCAICEDTDRDRGVICVVEQTRDIFAMERSRSYNGLYHILHGTISPLEGRGPEQLNIASLMKRLRAGGVYEVVMATNSTVEGEATSLYLARMIKPLNIRVTRIAHGIPVGGDLEYADEATLAQALSGRKEL